MFWRRLREYGLLEPRTEFEDDSLLEHGFGMTDIVKVPGSYGNEPSADEYKAGSQRVLEIIREHHPRVVVFVYKRVLNEMLRCLQLEGTSSYGFNPEFEEYFGARVFVFPMPGTPCSTERASIAMRELVSELEDS